MKLRALTDSGVDQFRAYLGRLRSEPSLPVPAHLLTDPDAALPLDTPAEVEPRTFDTRLDASRYLDGVLADSGLPEIERNPGLWSWLALFYFDQLCPLAKGHGRKPGEDCRYLLALDNSRRYYRHMLLGPWGIYHLHRDNPDRLLGLLSSPLHIATAETYRLFIENPSLVACRAVVAVATLLYFDRDRGKLKRGAGSKDSGGCRRLIDFLQQIDCTFDLPLLSEERLLQLLPDEFQRFIPRQLQLRL